MSEITLVGLYLRQGLAKSGRLLWRQGYASSYVLSSQCSALSRPTPVDMRPAITITAFSRGYRVLIFTTDDAALLCWATPEHPP